MSRTAIAGLDLVLSNDDRGELNTLLLHAPDGRLRLRHLLPVFRPHYDLLLIDTQGARSVLLEMDGEVHDLTQMSTESIVNLGVSMVPEGRRLFPKLTVEENLLLGAYRQQARGQIATNLEFSYEAFPLLVERRRQLAGSMSGGQQQMLAIARALMSSPKLLLVDEPSVGLSPLLVSHTITKIKELKEKYDLTVLMAEQNFNQAIRIADYGYIIVHGEIVSQGDVESLKNNDMVKNFYLGVSA